MKTMLAVAVAVGGLAAPVLAQMPKPGPEQARIGLFQGTWKYEGTAKASPMGPGGTVSMTETCRWFEGGFHLVCRAQGTNPRGPMTSQSIIGYDPAAKTYTLYMISSQGEGFMARGNVAGKVWTWTVEADIEGTPMTFRATATEESPTAYTFKLEVATGAGDWMLLEEGKSTKQ